MRFSTLLPCVVSMLLAACGDDGGSSATTDGGTQDGAAADAAMPTANCTALDLAAAPAITIMNGMVTPNPQGGTVAAGTFQLQSVKLYAQGIPVTGTAKSRIELVTGTATTGAARVALQLDGMALNMPLAQTVNAAGLYTASGTSLNVMEGCGGMNPLSALTYTATGTNLTIWTSYMVTNPIAITIPIELVYTKE